MEDSQYILMSYLFGKTEKIDRAQLANDLAYYYSETKYSYAAVSDLSNKKLIDRETWLPVGKFNEIFLKEHQARQTESFVSEMQFQKLSNEVADLENRLNNFMPSNWRANWALGISIFGTIVALIMLYLKLKE